jgi:type II secretory pathway pseudopilin PulG
MLRNRRGFTIIEIMTVVVMVILVTAITFPKLKETRRAASMQSARTQLESYVATARSVAVRNGVRAYLVRKNSQMRVMADSANTLVTVVRAIDFREVSNVNLSSDAATDPDTIIFDARGIATNLTAGRKFYITVATGQYGAGTVDSLCVTRFGMVLDRNCGIVPTQKDTLMTPIDILPAPPTPY